jgi:hypothetical protein
MRASGRWNDATAEARERTTRWRLIAAFISDEIAQKALTC